MWNQVLRCRVKVQASDPNGYCRPITLAALGCSPTPIGDWAVGLGTSAEGVEPAHSTADRRPCGNIQTVEELLGQ
jgi:hypothetical protein